MLIIVESFGLIVDSSKRKVFQKSISSVFEKYYWKTNWGNIPFSGSTTNAELRELLNCFGDYRFFNRPNNAKKFQSIFQIKKKQGYHISAIHSFTGNMFERSTWWKNIGADDVYFKEDLQNSSNFKIDLNFDTPFISVNDEDAFDFIQEKARIGGKHFTYILTENSHLPFKSIVKIPTLDNLFNIDKEAVLSEEAKNQNKRITSFLIYIAKNLDSCKFQKILIVGDHIPPFFKKNDRSFYCNDHVPYLILTK